MREYEHLLKTIIETCDYNNPNHRVRVYEFHENERMVFNKLEEMDLIKNVTHIGQRYIGFDLSYDAIHYFDENEEVINSNSNAFTYELPGDFEKRVIQILGQEVDACQVVLAFKRCKYEYEDVGLAYYAGVSGDNWNKKAVDFTFEGNQEDISILSSSKVIRDSISKALRSSVSGFVLRHLSFLSNEVDFLPLSDQDRLNADLSSANMVLNDIIRISEKLCLNATYSNRSSENSINDYYRNSFSLMGYHEVKDQTRHGLSSNGIDAGEVDILISKNDKEIAIFEGLKLDCINTTYIDTHIKKAIGNYNALGTATFVVAYVSSQNFTSFWDKYFSHIKEYSFSINVKKELSEKVQPNAAIKTSETILSRDGFDFPVYFIAVNINK